jgi:hypothetical protein
VNNALIIRAEAEADLTEQFDWYENRKRGLGYDFLAEVQSVCIPSRKNRCVMPKYFETPDAPLFADSHSKSFIYSMPEK